MSETSSDSQELQNLIKRLQSYKSSNQEQDFPGKSSAVLICLYQEKNQKDLRVILTKRSSTLSSHPGEVALPGGMRDNEDSDHIITALREAHEEIGLNPSLVTIVAVLEPFITKKGLPVVPVIGFLFKKEAFKPMLNPSEVEEIFDVPLEMFLKDENRRAEERESEGESYLLHYFDYYSEEKQSNFVIWALTAGILIRVASIVYQKPPLFLELKPKFWNQPN